VSDNQLQKRGSSPLKDKGQYLIAVAVVASMLWVANFPIFVIFFFGIFAYFLLRMFSSASRSETREIFEFYLTANEILRDDERRWYGFEVNEAIRRGEDIVQRMRGAPPLVHFALGALQKKAGDHKAAVRNLTYVVENAGSDEGAFVYPSPELRNYVKVLRKIERDPADAPMTSSAVRALERARKLRARTLLEESRRKFAELPPAADVESKKTGPESLGVIYASNGATANGSSDHRDTVEELAREQNERKPRSAKARKESPDPYADRKSISEVLHDIYDKNVQ
jgi:hypothetical protein